MLQRVQKYLDGGHIVLFPFADERSTELDAGHPVPEAYFDSKMDTSIDAEFNAGATSTTLRNVVYGRFGFEAGFWVTFYGGQAWDYLVRHLQHGSTLLNWDRIGAAAAPYHYQQEARNGKNAAWALAKVVGFTDPREIAECLCVAEQHVVALFKGFCMNRQYLKARAA